MFAKKSQPGELIMMEVDGGTCLAASNGGEYRESIGIIQNWFVEAIGGNRLIVDEDQQRFLRRSVGID